LFDHDLRRTFKNAVNIFLIEILKSHYLLCLH